MKARKRDRRVPSHPDVILAMRAAGLRSSGRRRDIVRQSVGRTRGIVPSLNRFPKRRLAWEASLERRLLRFCVFSHSVMDVQTEPTGLLIPHSDEQDSPDFEYFADAALAVLRTPGRTETVLAECKPKCFANAPEVRQRLDRIGQVLARSGVRFVVLTEHELPASLDTNLDKLTRAAKVQDSALTIQSARSALGGADHAPFGLLAERLGSQATLRAIARGWLHTDLWSSIGPDSIVHAQSLEAQDVARIL